MICVSNPPIAIKSTPCENKTCNSQSDTFSKLASGRTSSWHAHLPAFCRIDAPLTYKELPQSHLCRTLPSEWTQKCTQKGGIPDNTNAHSCGTWEYKELGQNQGLVKRVGSLSLNKSPALISYHLALQCVKHGHDSILHAKLRMCLAYTPTHLVRV